MSTLARQALQKFSLNKLNHPCHFLGLLRILCPYFDLCNSRPFLLMFPCGMLRLLYYFSISKNIIYSPFVFLFPLQYHPVLADQPTCYLSISVFVIFYGHPLMTSQSLSPTAFSSLLWSCVSTFTLFGPRKQAVHRWLRPFQGSPWVDSKKTQGNEMVLVQYKFIHMFEYFCKPVVSSTDLVALLVCTDSPHLSSLPISITT